ncbi:MAG: helix-turn-helix transcriptional regulator [Clostridiaceae bacterium]
MSICVTLDMMLRKRKMSSSELSHSMGRSAVNISRIKTGKIKSIRFSTLEAICKELECQPGDILIYKANHESI